MQGQAAHFVRFAPEQIEYGIKRYTNETKRLYGVIEKALSDGRQWLAAGEYTIADIANFSWMYVHQMAGDPMLQVTETTAGCCSTSCSAIVRAITLSDILAWKHRQLPHYGVKSTKPLNFVCGQVITVVVAYEAMLLCSCLRWTPLRATSSLPASNVLACSCYISSLAIKNPLVNLEEDLQMWAVLQVSHWMICPMCKHG